jgi:uncharacterized protein (TIGR00269 family)
MDEAVKKLKVMPCSLCGILRRYLLNKYSRKLKADKLVTGHNLDDEAQTILMNQFRRNIETSARLGPITGVVKDPLFVRRVKPLYFLTEEETTLYAELKKFPFRKKYCPYAGTSYRNSVKKFLNDFEKKYPGTKHSIVNSFLEILPLLKQKYKTTKRISACKKCKEPCSGEICQVCETLEKIK